MPQLEEDTNETGRSGALSTRRWQWVWRVLLGLTIGILVLFAFLWSSRLDIAGNLIAKNMQALGLPATYEIESIGPQKQVVSNIVIGDPARPDLTIDRVTVAINYRFGIPYLGKITLDRPRLYGRFRNGSLSFGSLDPVLFTDTDDAPGLPAYDIALVDGRGLIESDFGPIGFKAEGSGNLNSGFSGILAAMAPQILTEGCEAKDASLYGTVRTKSGKPAFNGPLRLGKLSCSGNALKLDRAVAEVTATSDSVFSTYQGSARLETGPVSVNGNRADGLTGTIRADWHNHALDAGYVLAGRSVGTAQVNAALMTAEGSLRTRNGFDQIELASKIEGNGVGLGNVIDTGLAGFADSTRDTLVAPLLVQIRKALQRESKGSRLAADVTLRKTGEAISLVLPQASLQGGSGANLLSVSGVQLAIAGVGRARFSGNLVTGGAGLPAITGRMEGNAGGSSIFRLQMSEYGAGKNRIAIPELVVAQGANGALGFSGRVRASGALPGGSAENLILPLDGNRTAGGVFSFWRKCAQVKFDRLALANLVLDGRSLSLCPRSGQPILRKDARGIRFAAGTPSLNLSGTLAETPIRIASGAAGFAYPGSVTVQDIDVALGEAASANKFTIANLDAELGPNIAGTFAGADIRLFAVPLDLLNTSGRWDYSAGVFKVDDGVFTLHDRTDRQLFNPMLARGSTLTLANNLIHADAVLREPTSGREIGQVAIVHDLSRTKGYADLSVPGLKFDTALQPEQLSELALGVIALAEGTITGNGRIDWNGDAVTSKGTFRTDSLDFAAAFGPVKGASGTIVFTDLINITTAPNQKLRIASINPGVEVMDGEITFRLEDTRKLSVTGGGWPFMGGTLSLRPVILNLGVGERRAYVFDILGLDAAQFVSQMDLANLSATGIFDGTVPIIFDEFGDGTIEGGALRAREQGGNVSYVGELTYKDLSPMANFAFSTLRSLNYQKMTVGMEGKLSGELVTRVQFDGVTQGSGTKTNFITRQISKLPIRFNVNVRAPFYQLITSFKAMYDPAFVKDPRELGLVGKDGKRLNKGQSPATQPGNPVKPALPVAMNSDEPPIQSPESERVP